jgi:CHASE2 domain-containing sensor protein
VVHALLSHTGPLPKEPGYWITAALVLLVCFLVRPYLERYLDLVRLRDSLFQWLNELNHRPLEPRFVKLVLVEDDDYWKGEPAGRRPIKRSYLATLVRALGEADAATIALDFDLRLPDPNSMTIPADYEAETTSFIDSIVEVAGKRDVVLPKTIWFDKGKGYKADPDIYQPYGLCLSAGENGHWHSPGRQNHNISEQTARHIKCGYIALSEDRRVLPGRVTLNGGGHLDSFALAVAKTNNPNSAVADDRVVYGSYIPPKNFKQGETIFSAGELLSDSEVRRKLAHKVVILGGNWSTLACGRGAKVDRHETPVGRLSGALIHANFVEALLDDRKFVGLPDWMLHGLEIAFGLVTALVFALYQRWLPGELVAVAGLSLVLLIITYFMLQIFGILFDGGILLLGLWLHALVEHAIRT